MFSRWGRFVYRRRRPVALVAILVAVGVFASSAIAPAQLSTGGWLDPRSESAAVADHLAEDFGAGRSSLIVLFRSTANDDARSGAYQTAIAETLAPLLDDPAVADVVGFAETRDGRFISTDGDSAYVVVRLETDDEGSIELLDGIRDQLVAPAGYSIALTGYAPLQEDNNHQSEADLLRAEVVSLPLALLILILVFASLVAAGMPLLVAGLAIPTSLGLVNLVAGSVEMSIYVTNIATMLGLALAIDYSLFIVSRFREELARGRTTGEAVEKAVATAGKAVLFSGLAVSIGLSGLLLFPAAALRSIGIGGSLVVVSSVFFALTLLPAVLGMLGPRVNALSLRHGFDAVRTRLGLRTGAAAAAASAGRWERVAHWVMRRPVLVLVPTLTFLLVLGLPFLRIVQGVPDAAAMPAGLSSRDAYVAIQSEFPRGETTPIVVLAEVEGDPTSSSNALALARYGTALAALDGVDRVASAFAIDDPLTGEAMTPEAIAAFWAAPAEALPPEVAAAREQLRSTYIAGSTVRFDAISPREPATPAATGMIPDVRELQVEEGITTTVGGSAALGYDFLASMQSIAPAAVAVTLIASAIVLFLLFGSVVIPIKAVLMTLLSITASFGALVWIFQEGNLAGLLAFEPLGYTIAGNPIIMFSVLFGLSMDYEVLLLSRIQEAYRRTGDNTEAVAEGLAKTAGVITGAALIMVTVFASFALAETITIKSIGVGMAIAVALDATVIRVLLVPATMRLMGRWNWWAPGPLKRFADRLGFDHVEDEDEAAEPGRGEPELRPATGQTTG
jgi:RND superfamily putative drug exporter